jgi:cytochrome c-type biogenesis protein CcmH/NrfG
MLRFNSLVLLVLLLVGCQSSTPQFTQTAFAPAIDSATAAYQSGDLQLAEGLWRQLLERDPTLVEGWCHLGHIDFRQHRYDSALTAYQKCLRYKPQQTDIWQNMAVIRLRQASELMIRGSAFLLPSEGVDNNQDYQRLLQSLMLLQRVSKQSSE